MQKQAAVSYVWLTPALCRNNTSARANIAGILPLGVKETHRYITLRGRTARNVTLHCTWLPRMAAVAQVRTCGRLPILISSFTMLQYLILSYLLYRIYVLSLLPDVSFDERGGSTSIERSRRSKRSKSDEKSILFELDEPDYIDDTVRTAPLNRRARGTKVMWSIPGEGIDPAGRLFPSSYCYTISCNLVSGQNTKRESGRRVQLGNISAAKTIADVIRTCLGPRAMLKVRRICKLAIVNGKTSAFLQMLMDPMGGIVMTNDGNAILREIQVQHPAAKSMIEISRTQDEETGDGTTSVIILAGQVLNVAEPFLEQKIHPTIIIQAFRMALEDIIAACRDQLSIPVDVNNEAEVIKVVKSCLNTKMSSQWMDLAIKMALDAVRTVAIDVNGRKEIDIKRFVRIEKIPGGTIDESCVVKGVVLNKDVTHAKMRRHIEKPRIVLLDCPLEYKKGESQTNIEISKEEDFAKILQLEEDAIRKQCDAIIRMKPDVVFTEKGVSDLAQHFLLKANVTAIRRLKKTDNDRLARACGATIVNDPEELREECVGTGAGLFEIKKIGDEYFLFVTECTNAKACTILLRGASKDVLNEVDRNLRDATHVVRNILQETRVVPGGGAVEMALAQILNEKSKSIQGVRQWPYKAISRALEIIPRTLIQNCGGNTVRQLTALRAKHAQPNNQMWGVDGTNGNLVDMKELGIWDSLAVKLQVYKAAIETAILLLRIDDIVSGTKKADGSDDKKEMKPQQEEPPQKD